MTSRWQSATCGSATRFSATHQAEGLRQTIQSADEQVSGAVEELPVAGPQSSRSRNRLPSSRIAWYSIPRSPSSFSIPFSGDFARL